MNLSKISLNQLVNFTLATFLLLGIAATTYSVNNLNGFSADAAKGGGGSTGGKGGGKHGGGGTPSPCSACTVSLISTNPVPLGTAPTFHGTGFNSGDTILVMISGFLNGDVITADSTGSFTYTWWTAINIPGSYTFTAQTPDGRWANTSFTVQ